MASPRHIPAAPDLTAAGYARGIGPGVWDIHSPRVPDVAEIAGALSLALRAVGGRAAYGSAQTAG